MSADKKQTYGVASSAPSADEGARRQCADCLKHFDKKDGDENVHPESAAAFRCPECRQVKWRWRDVPGVMFDGALHVGTWVAHIF